MQSRSGLKPRLIATDIESGFKTGSFADDEMTLLLNAGDRFAMLHCALQIRLRIF